jgi:hypothetical protein
MVEFYITVSLGGVMSNGDNDRHVPPFIEKPQPDNQAQVVRLVLMLIGFGTLFLSVLGAGKILWEFLTKVKSTDVKPDPEIMVVKLLWLGILFLVSWVVSLINIRILHSWLHPLMIRGFIWLTIGGILALYARIIYKFYNEEFLSGQYPRYLGVLAAGFTVLVILQLLEEQDLRLYSLAVLPLTLIHLLTAVLHYVFRNSNNLSFAMGDAFWLFFMLIMFVLILLLAPLQQMFERAIPRNDRR